MTGRTLETWANLLRHSAALTLSPSDLSDLRAGFEPFTDEQGDSRAVDPWLVSAALGKPPPADARADTDDLRLWAAACGRDADPDAALCAASAGRLLRLPAEIPIELLTESELSALHALWTVSRVRNRQDLVVRCLAAAAWHTRELQPDNATNLPWAIHVFIVFGVSRGDPTALIDAETRLHNATAGAGTGRPDRRSALILHHAAAELELLAAGTAQITLA